MYSDTFLQGLARVLNCSKVQVAATGLATTYVAVRFAAGELPPAERASMYVAFVAAVAVQLREIINAWTEEDVARVANEASDPAPALPELSVAAPIVEHPAPRSAENPVSLRPAPQPQPRNPAMPARTRLPMVLIASSLLAMVSTTGCQTPPELSVYREGLHQVDEPLYTAHLLLMDDAVAANLRTDADRQVVQSGIAAARGVYEQSRATEGVGTPAATKP